MPFPFLLAGAGISAIGSIISGSKGASAAKSAAATQAAAQDRAIEEQKRQFDTIRQILAPYVQAGSPELTQPYIQAGPGAIRGLQALAGLGGEQARQQDLFQIRQSPEFTKLKDAAKQQALLKPVLESDKYDQLGRQMQEQAIQQIEQGPLYQQLAQQGEQAILANAAATGGLRGGNVQAALGQFRPQLLNQLIEQQYARLAGIANVGQTGAQSLLGIGQASAAGQAAAAGQAGNAISGLLASQGAAQAAGQVGAAQSFAQGMSGAGSAIGGAAQNYMLLNALGAGGSGGSGSGQMASNVGFLSGLKNLLGMES